MGKGRGLRRSRGHCRRGLWDILAGEKIHSAAANGRGRCIVGDVSPTLCST